MMSVGLLILGLTLATSPVHAGRCESALAAPESPLIYARSVLAKGTEHVKIHQRQIVRVANALDRAKFEITTPTWSEPPYPPSSLSFDHAFTYFLSLDSIAYMYRDHETDRTFDHGGYIGADLLAERLATLTEDLSRPRFLSGMSLPQLLKIVMAENPLVDLPRRVGFLRAVGLFRENLGDRDLKRWLRRFPNALGLVDHLARNIPGFNDGFLPRAQLFVYQLVGRYPRQIPKRLRDLEGLTVLADDVLPAVLWRMGILEYHDSLRAKLQRHDLIFANSIEEREIRASTLIAADRLLTALRAKERYRNLTVIELDALLRVPEFDPEVPGARLPAAVFKHAAIPRHRTITTSY